LAWTPSSYRDVGRFVMSTHMIWKCEQWVGGRLQGQTMFPSEAQAKAFVRQLEGVAPDLTLKIEPMPIQHVWN